MKKFSLKFKDPKENVNLSNIKSFESLKETSRDVAPRQKFYKREVTYLIYSKKFILIRLKHRF